MPTDSKSEKPVENDSSNAIKSETPKRRWGNRRLIIGMVLIILLISGGAVFLFLGQNQTDQTSNEQAGEEEQSLAEKLENVEFAYTPSEEDTANHYLNVAFTYMGEDNYDKALEFYLKAEEGGITSSRMFKDIATIYKSQNNDDKYSEYTSKYLSQLEQEASDEKDKLSVVATYITIGHEYEDSGDIESAKQSYQKAKDILDSYKPSDKYSADSARESKSFLEDKLKSL